MLKGTVSLRVQMNAQRIEDSKKNDSEIFFISSWIGILTLGRVPSPEVFRTVS